MACFPLYESVSTQTAGYKAKPNGAAVLNRGKLHCDNTQFVYDILGSYEGHIVGEHVCIKPGDRPF